MRTGGADAPALPRRRAAAAGAGTCASARDRRRGRCGGGGSDGRATTVGAAGGASWMRGVCWPSEPGRGHRRELLSRHGPDGGGGAGRASPARSAASLRFSSSLSAW